MKEELKGKRKKRLQRCGFKMLTIVSHRYTLQSEISTNSYVLDATANPDRNNMNIYTVGFEIILFQTENLL